MDILVVDDNSDVIKSLKKVLEDYRVIGAANFSQVKNILEKYGNIGIIIIDVRLGNEDGIEVLKYVKAKYPLAECIMISGYSTIEKAVEALKLGAYDFLEKPLSFHKVKVTIRNAYEHRSYLRLLNEQASRYNLAGNSRIINKLRKLIDRAASTEFPVLISGETGSGKEHVANLIHLKGRRSQNEIITVNCAAIPESLFESELFGHEKGSFTGAHKTRIGKIEQANGSTLFLDEIGEMPLTQQAKLLRVIENKEFFRLGSEKKLKAEFRLISATNKDLESMLDNDSFRTDLFYRISAIRIHVPSLRERKEDIPLLTNYFLKKILLEYGGAEKHFTGKALGKLSLLPFKGNIRELKNLVQQLYILVENEEITENDINRVIMKKNTGIDEVGIFTKSMHYSDAKKILEKKYIRTQLKLHNYNISITAIDLDILPNNLIRKMKTLNIKIG